MTIANPAEWIFGTILMLSALGVVLFRKPIHSCLSFLLTLLLLAALYMELSATFIGVMQILVYGGAILVLFMFVIVLFQDAHSKISQNKNKLSYLFLTFALNIFSFVLIFFAHYFFSFPSASRSLPPDFGFVEPLGKALYLDFFFPFEAVILLFLVAVVGALYIGKKEGLDGR